MYTIHADGKLLFDSLSEDVSSIALAPKVSLNINKAGFVSFVLPPGNSMHGNLKKLKSIVTVEQDGVQIARGRVTETELDTYNQDKVYCEGEKNFLLDSVHEPYTYSGTVHGLFQKLITNHNSMVDANRQFVVGMITAVGDSEKTEIESITYADTYSEIEARLLNAYGGYLRTRTVDGVYYIDWVKEYGEENSQSIEFSVNLLDLTDKADASDVFTVLIPLGASEIGDDGEFTDPLSIESVNDGLNYIQDDEAVAQYGKIWRTYTWNYIDDPAQLLEKGREYLKTGVALETLTLKAIDMHFTDENVQPIRIGDRVHILSNPHGIDKMMVCSQIEIDLRNPENTVYTFGEAPRTLIDNYVDTEEEVTGGSGGRGGGIKQEVGELKRWAYLRAVPELGKIEGFAKDINDLTGRTGEVELYMSAVESIIKLKAERSIFNEFDDRISSTEITLNGDEATIGLIAEVKDTRERISNAGIKLDGEAGTVYAFVSKGDVISAINMSTEKITISADKISLDGYVTAEMLESKFTNMMNGFAETFITENFQATTLATLATAIIRGKGCNWTSSTVVSGITKPVLAGKTIWYVDHDGNKQNVWVATGWSTQLGYSTENIEYMTSYGGDDEGE